LHPGVDSKPASTPPVAKVATIQGSSPGGSRCSRQVHCSLVTSHPQSTIAQKPSLPRLGIIMTIIFQVSACSPESRPRKAPPANPPLRWELFTRDAPYARQLEIVAQTWDCRKFRYRFIQLLYSVSTLNLSTCAPDTFRRHR